MGTIYKAQIGKEDLAVNSTEVYPTTTFNRLTSLGGTTAITYLPDLYKTHNATINARFFGSAAAQNDTAISSAISYCGGASRRIYLEPGTWTISNDLTIPAYIDLDVAPGAIMSVASGKTLTVNGTIKADDYQIFSGTGTVSGLKYANLVWFGGKPTGATTDFVAALKAAVSATATGGTLLIPGYGSTTYYKYDNAANGQTDSAAVNKTMNIRVDGTIKQTGYAYQASPASIFLVTGSNVVIEGNGTLQGPGTYTHAAANSAQGSMASLICISSATNVTVQDLRFVDVPQVGISISSSPETKIYRNKFTGGDTVTNLQSPNISYFGIYASSSDKMEIKDNFFTDDSDGDTFAEGMFIYNSDYLTITGNYFKNIVDHDIYANHGSSDITYGVNNSTISNNTSYTTLTATTEKDGSSIKVQGEHNIISENNLYNTIGGIILECGRFSRITNNIISGFSDKGIVVTDLVATNATGNNYITIDGNTLYADASGTAYGIYFRGDATYSTANVVGGKITNNTIIRAGSSAGLSNSPIYIAHSNGSYFMDGFTVSGNTIIGHVGAYGMYLDRVRYSKFVNNYIKDGTYTGWRGFYLYKNCTFNEFTKNTVRDDQGTPLASYGIMYGDNSDTDIISSGNIFHSLYASRAPDPWSASATYRRISDRNVHDDTLGYPISIEVAEGKSDIEADASTTITLSIPTGARLIGSQLRVDAALATGETWDAAYSGGCTTAIAAAQAVAKNTKVKVLYDENAASAITTDTTNIAITKNGGGSFTAQGTVRALVYYELLTTLGDLA